MGPFVVFMGPFGQLQTRLGFREPCLGLCDPDHNAEGTCLGCQDPLSVVSTPSS